MENSDTTRDERKPPETPDDGKPVLEKVGDALGMRSDEPDDERSRPPEDRSPLGPLG
jgi:hypothetical protein